MARILVLFVITLLMYFLPRAVPSAIIAPEAASTVSFGFLILAGYLTAGVLTRIRLPKITGYILAGMLFGPSALGFLTQEVVADLKLVDDLVLTVIAFAAGGELRLGVLRERMRSIAFTLLGTMVIVAVGVTVLIFAMRSAFPLTAGKPAAVALAVAAICGVVAVARSPASAIAIISETKSKGPFTEMVLGVTVAADVLTVFFFAVVLSLSEVIVAVGQSVNVVFLLGVVAEVVASLVLGVVFGRGIALYLEKVGSELTVFVLGLAFLITKSSHWLGAYLSAEFGVQFHLEPMLICLAAGFYVQNLSRHGGSFLRVIDRSSLPLYAIFFTLTGASLDLAALRTTWFWALILVAIRAAFIYSGAYIGGRFAADSPTFQKASGLGFLTQAGVSLGLAKLVADRFPGFGAELATLLVAAIAVNQIIGPAGFKFALSWVGETKEARLAHALKRG